MGHSNGNEKAGSLPGKDGMPWSSVYTEEGEKFYMGKIRGVPGFQGVPCTWGFGHFTKGSLVIEKDPYLEGGVLTTGQKVNIPARTRELDGHTNPKEEVTQEPSILLRKGGGSDY